MANSVVESPVPLAGAGFLAKPRGHFNPGEYKRLNNIEIDRDGYLVNRRNIYSVHGDNAGQAVTPLDNIQTFLGNMGPYTLLTNGTNQYMVGKGSFTTLWNTFAAGAPTSAGSYSRFVGFFRYNNKNFWLVFEFDAGVAVRLVLYNDASIPTPDVPSTYVAGYQTSLTRTVILTFNNGTPDFYNFQFKNFFVYKERLWIATSVGLYFSKATDPTIFAVPDGGFFKHPDSKVNYAFAIKDIIYTLCENSVFALNYNTDPNVDSTERPISDSIGGEMGCVHLDQPYFINSLGIYAINGANIEKILDNDFDVGRDFYRNRITSFEQYLVVNKYQKVNYDNNYSLPSTATTRRNLWPNPESTPGTGSEIIGGWTSSKSADYNTRTNLCTNPSFESGAATNWTPVNTNTVLGISNSNAVTGTKSLSINRSVSNSAYYGVYQDIIISPVAGTAFTFSSYFKTTFLNGYTAMYIEFFNGSTSLGLNDVGYGYIDNTSWHRFALTATAPAGVTKIRISLLWNIFADQGTYLVDGILFEQGTTLGSYFDGANASTTYMTYAWNGTGFTSSSTAVAKTSTLTGITAVADTGQAGKVFKLTGGFPCQSSVGGALPADSSVLYATKTLTTTTALVAGTPYTLSFNHRITNSYAWKGCRLKLLIEYLNGASAVLGSLSWNVNSNYQPAAYAQATNTGLTPPTGTVSIRLTFSIIYTAESIAGNQAVNFYVNKIILEKSETYSGYFMGATTSTPDVSYFWASTAYASESTSGSSKTHGYLKNNGSKFDPFQGDNSLGYNTYFINTDTGAVHVVDFTDQYNSYSAGDCGFIVDMAVNPFKDNDGNYNIFFITNKFISGDVNGLAYKGDVYYMNSSRDTQVNDFVLDVNNILQRKSPRINIEIESFLPDGVEYRTKKFRSLLLEAELNLALQIEVGYNNSEYAVLASTSDTESTMINARPPYPHRLGLNQRGRSISFRLTNPTWNNNLTDALGLSSITDMRVLWTPTQRLMESNTVGS